MTIKIILSIVIIFLLYKREKHNINIIKQLEANNKELQIKIDQQIENNKKIFSQKKSSEVRTGFIVEKLAPYMDDFPISPYKCHFLGNPIDYIGFDETGIYIIEVKSGNARLSAVQKMIKQLVKEGKVFFKEFKIKGNK